MRNYHKKDKPSLDHRITVRFEADDYVAIARRALQAELPVAEYWTYVNTLDKKS